MGRYQNSDYALNKYAEGIVYRLSGRIVEITLSDYLAENPEKTEQDFRALKVLSDAIYYEQDRAEYNQTRKNISIHGMEESRLLATPPLEDAYMELQEKRRTLLAATLLLDSGNLTEAQRRRFILYIFHGLSSRKIAEREGVTQRAIIKSLHAANKKLQKYFSGPGTHTPA